MLIRYPRRVTVNIKKTCIKTQKVRENQLTGPSRHCIYAYTKAMALLRITNGNNSNSIGPALRFLLKIEMCLQGLIKFHQ